MRERDRRARVREGDRRMEAEERAAKRQEMWVVSRSCKGKEQILP